MVDSKFQSSNSAISNLHAYLSPAILSKDVKDYEYKIDLIKGLVNSIQIDIMDGKFVPNQTLSPELYDKKTFDSFEEVRFHLMVYDWLSVYNEFDLSGKKYVFELHYEAFSNKNELIKTFEFLKSKNVRLSLAINPETSYEVINEFIDYLDSVLVMFVNPGFSGQKFLESNIAKVEMISKEFSYLRIAVDGGISFNNIPKLYEAGARIFCAASSIFNSQNPRNEIVKINDLLKKLSKN